MSDISLCSHHPSTQSYYRFLCTADANESGAVLQQCLALGATNLRVMELLEHAHVKSLGIPEPTTVRTTPVKGKGILITGHDMGDLKALLEQTEGTGVNVYTHGEMLPGHAYPELKKHRHLVGNLYGAWYRYVAHRMIKHQYDTKSVCLYACLYMYKLFHPSTQAKA